MIQTSLQIACSLVLAAVFGASAVPKLRHPKGFVLAVLMYRVLPPRLSRSYAMLLPPVELLIALLLVSGTGVRLAAVIAAALLLSFIAAVGLNIKRGRYLDCHCFGRSARRSIGWGLLAKDGVLLGVATVLAAVATTWVTPAPWSMLRLAGLTTPGSPAPLLWCTGVTAVAAVLLGRPVVGRRRYGDALTSR
jgi:hypothetical protein